jgi:hypothetical protein
VAKVTRHDAVGPLKPLGPDRLQSHDPHSNDEIERILIPEIHLGVVRPSMSERRRALPVS